MIFAGFLSYGEDLQTKKIGEFDMNYRINSFSYSPDREHDVMAADCLEISHGLAGAKRVNEYLNVVLKLSLIHI